MKESRLFSVESRDASSIRTDGIREVKSADQWLCAIPFLICTSTLLLAFRHTVLQMVGTWYSSRTYSHCFLIVPIFFYLVWSRRRSLAALMPVVNYWGLLLLAGLAFVWLIGNLAEVKVVQELALVGIFIALVGTLLGSAVVRALAFPLFFLFFAVPFGTSLIKPLQDFTAWFVIHALTASNIPAVLENHMISLPSGVWTVAEACSGIRFLLSSVVLGMVFSFLVYRSLKRRLIFMCASIIVPIVGNGLRAYGTILLAVLTNNRFAAGIDHIVYGGFFAVFIQLVLMAAGLRWRENEPGSVIAAGDLEIATERSNDNGSLRKKSVLAGAGALALIALAPIAAARLWETSTTAVGWRERPVIVNSPWQATAIRDTTWAPERHNPDKEFNQSYKHDADRVDVDCVLYSGHREMDFGARPDGIPDANSWALVSDGDGSALVDGRPVKVGRRTIKSGAVVREVWTWYYVSGGYTGDRGRVRLLQAKARLLGKSAAVAVISLGIDRQTDQFQTEQTLQDFLIHASFAVPTDVVSRTTTQQAKAAPSSQIEEGSGTVP